MSLVNKFKLLYRDEPLSFIDIKLIKESFIMAKRYKFPLSFKVIILLSAFILIIIILTKYFDYKISSKKLRLSLLLIISLSGVLIFKGFYFDPNIYSSVGDKKLINIWVKSDQFQSKGFVYPFIYSITEAKERKLAGYDEEKAIEDLNAYKYQNIPETQKVNIISIMLEAYNDFSEFPGVELGMDIYKNFHQLQKDSIHGKLITNVFAGGTINTERAFLTGYHNHPSYFKTTNSFVWYLKEQGYKTEGMHPITGSFYNRRNINEYLGFDSFDHYDNKYQYKQKSYLDDMDFFDYIIEGYKNSSKQEPYFNFSVTYQNHGPYPTEKKTEKEYLVKKSHYDEGTYNIINNYLAGIAKTDEALKKLVSYYRKEKEPVILVIFGDHNPWLGKDHTGYDMLNIDMDLSTIEGVKNYYQTPYVMWANEAARKLYNKDFAGENADISPNFLMAELFEYIDWQGNEYMQYITDMKDNFNVNHMLYFKEDSKYKKELSEVNKKVWTDFMNVEYYYSHNFIK